MISQEQDAARLQAVLNSFYAGQTTRDAARSAVIDVVLQRIGCSRVSLWKFAGHDGELTLLCFASKRAGGELDTTESRLHQAEYGDYFNALATRAVFNSADAMNEPALQPMRERYLVPNGIVSLLDAAFTLNGRAYGMICCEEIGTPRAWRPGDVTALRAIVARLALLMAGEPGSALWQTPSRPLQALPPTPAPGHAADA
jgi:GAF domain-containing protein